MNINQSEASLGEISLALLHNDSCCSQFVWSLSLSDSTHVAETLHTDVRRERDDGKNRVLPNDASYNSDTCSAIFFIFMVFCICVFSYHVSRSYSVSLSPVVLTTSLPLFICCPENTVDSAFIASVRLEGWLLLLYGRKRRCFLLPSSMYWRIWINQALVAGLLSPIWGLCLPFLLFVLEPKGQVSAPSLWTAPKQSAVYVLRYFSSTTAQRTWGGQEKRNTQNNQTPACSGGKSGPFDESVLSNSWFGWTSTKNDSVILSSYHVLHVCVL